MLFPLTHGKTVDRRNTMFKKTNKSDVVDVTIPSNAKLHKPIKFPNRISNSLKTHLKT